MSFSTTPAATALPLADRVRIAIEGVLDTAPDTNEAKYEALAEATLHCFGVHSVRKNWADDARALAELVKAVGFIADSNIGGPCAIPPGVILGIKPASLRAQPPRALRVVTDDRPADTAADGTPYQPYDERNGWGG